MPTTRELVDRWRPHIGGIPHASHDYVCSACLGPVTGYERCYGCYELFVQSGAPHALRTAAVPMSSAVSPGPWYSALATYKTFQPANAGILASVTYHFLETHRPPIEAMLGGPVSLLTIVPSKRGISYADQPLRKALALVEPLRNQLRNTLVLRPDHGIGRKEYNPEAFAPSATPVDNERIVLIEDTWVTGATAVSAAGALLAYGAASVAIVPIARRISDQYWPADHPYRIEMKRCYQPYHSSSWPR